MTGPTARVALVTHARLGDLAERVAGHFVSAEIKHFQGDQMEAARAWLAQTGA
ncbi:MAG: STAS/SEC14 domain-containing protein [Chromatiaceae bacterium]